MKNILSFLILILYVLLLAALWINSSHPSLSDIPVLYTAGFVMALVHVLVRKNKGISNITGIINIILFVLCFIQLAGVYRLLKSIFNGN